MAIHIVFDGPPSHVSGRFVEVENDAGASISIGEWRERANGLWALVIDSDAPELLAALEAAEIEITEAADKMHVLGLNHPGGGRYLDEDKKFMAVLSERFWLAAFAARAAIAKARGAAT